METTIKWKMSRAKIETLLGEYGIRLSKRRGQPHVVDPRVLERMVNYAGLSPKDTVLEVGAGVGNLTELLSQRAGRVVAVEEDDRLARLLKERLGGCSNVEILRGDALKLELPKFDKIVANLPYSISSDITFRLLEHDFQLAVLMYQKEFARRLVASPGERDYGRLSVSVYYRAKVEILEEVPPRAFFPRPKVTSAIVRLKPRAPPFEVGDEEAFADVVRAMFQHRRQKVCNALLRSFGEVFPGLELSRGEKRRMIREVLPGGLWDKRPADVSPEEYGKIANSVATFRSSLLA